MLHRILEMSVGKRLDNVAAHCDIPCKIYDPATAQLAALSVIRYLDLIAEIKDAAADVETLAKLSRLVADKEKHAETVKHEVRVIWGDYIKQPQFDQFPDISTLVHSIMLAGSACKQSTVRANGEKLLTLVNEFAAAFWATKGVATFTADCPYPPTLPVVYPDLKS